MLVAHQDARRDTNAKLFITWTNATMSPAAATALMQCGGVREHWCKAVNIISKLCWHWHFHGLNYGMLIFTCVCVTHGRRQLRGKGGERLAQPRLRVVLKFIGVEDYISYDARDGVCVLCKCIPYLMHAANKPYRIPAKFSRVCKRLHL